MPVDLTKLVPEFGSQVDDLLQQCAAAGITMRPNEGLRDPFVQAKYWRQSRPIEQIHAKIDSLKAQGAPFLAFCLESVGPQSGDPVTNATPGLSWHQWGEALDCFWVVNGEAEWSTTRKVNGKNGFHEYAQLAQDLGLTPGGFFKKLKDWPHVQLRPDGSPLSIFTLVEIDAEMKSRFG